jgi:hypothetical protein
MLWFPWKEQGKPESYIVCCERVSKGDENGMRTSQPSTTEVLTHWVEPERRTMQIMSRTDLYVHEKRSLPQDEYWQDRR